MISILQQNIEFFLSLVAGVALIIFSMRNLASGFQVVFSTLIKSLVNSLNTNPVVCVLIGVVNSFFIQSGFSSSVMALSYAGSGLLNQTQTFLLLIGSGIGTVATVWLFTSNTAGLDLYLIAIGVLPMMYGYTVLFSALGKIIFSVGLLLFGFNIMLVPPTEPLIGFSHQWLSTLSNMPAIGTFFIVALAIAILAFVLRSTVAIIALTMVLLHFQMIPSIIAVMIAVSVNFGRTLPIFASTIASGNVPSRSALGNVIINFVSMLFVAFMFDYFLGAVFEIASLFNSFVQPMKLDSYYVPLAHLFFNLIIVIAALALFKPLGYLLELILPGTDKKQPQKLMFPGKINHISATLAIEQVYQEVKKMAATCETTLQLTIAYLGSQEPEIVDKVLKYEKVTDNIRKEIYDFMAKVMEVSLSSKQGEQVRSLIRIANELEGIADRCKQIILSRKEISQIGIPVESELNDHIKKVMDKLKEIYEMTFLQLTVSDNTISQDYRSKLRQFDQTILNLKKDYIHWVKTEAESEYQIEASLKYGDILFAVQQIRGRSQNVFEAYRYGYVN